MVFSSDKYYFLGRFKDTHYFFGKKRKVLVTVYNPKIKWIDKENNIVYFFDKNKISYSYSAIKKHSKDFLDKELEKLYRNANRKFYVGQILKYKSIKESPYETNYNNTFIEIIDIVPMKNSGSVRIHFIFKRDGSVASLSIRELISHTLDCNL